MDSMKKKKVHATIMTLENKRKVFSALLGAFLHKSSHGNLYAMVVYDYDRNRILPKPIKTGKKQLPVMPL